MTNINSRPWRCGRIALIALLFSIFCGVARAGDIAPCAGNPVPASETSARADIYFRLHAEVRAAAILLTQDDLDEFASAIRGTNAGTGLTRPQATRAPEASGVAGSEAAAQSRKMRNLKREHE